MRPFTTILLTSLADARPVPNLREVANALTPIEGFQAAPDWTPLTRDLLGIPQNGSENLCLKPDSSDLVEWSSALSSAERQYKLKRRLTPFFERLRENGHNEDWTDVGGLLGRLDRCAQVLEDVCLSHVRDGRELKPAWSEEPQTLKSQAVKFIYDHLFEQFDKTGYSQLTKSILEDDSQMRFSQSLASIQSSMPHCDVQEGQTGNMGVASGAPFPGGPFRLNFGFNLAKMLSEQLMAAGESGASGQGPIGQMMTMMAVMAVISIVETVVGIVIDIVPPMIPPPFWILWSLPCLPMLTGPNCLFSVLYPIGLSDFMLASTTDQIMNGVISGFPSKYAMKVGKTDDIAYRMCAMAYLGMYCASIFPICWLPLGVRTAMSFPMCFVHCILTLVACPGFWIDDIIGPCTTISVPPLCSFSLYLNSENIPPQYTSYADGHPFPADCPEFDAAYDDDPYPPSPPKLGEGVGTGGGGAGGGGGGGIVDIPPMESGDSLVGDLSDFANVVTPKYLLCDCSKLCTVTDGAGDDCEQDTGCENACAHVSHPRGIGTSTTTLVPAEDANEMIDKGFVAQNDPRTKDILVGHTIVV